ncbi:MAG: cupin domain-containing protein [Crocinitomicaceae bacterium]|nr:cupin domain-containing protein [Crocinitomicaceae bacterium]
MKRIIIISTLVLAAVSFAQNIVGLKDLKPEKEFDNIFIKKVSDDDYQSTFVIWVKQKVRLHKHEHHSENIYVLEGKGEMVIGDEKFVIKKGDYFNIPKNTPHGLKVLSSSPVKVLSIQSPQFLGQDRIFLED